MKIAKMYASCDLLCTLVAAYTHIKGERNKALTEDTLIMIPLFL